MDWKKRLMELAEQASKEQDTAKFLKIIAEMDAVFAADEGQMVKDKPKSPSSE